MWEFAMPHVESNCYSYNIPTVLQVNENDSKMKNLSNMHMFADYFVSFCFLAGVKLPVSMKLYPLPCVEGERCEQGGTDQQQQCNPPHAAYCSFHRIKIEKKMTTQK
jgi:hypothetical protein